jgi:hypothetical protein
MTSDRAQAGGRVAQPLPEPSYAAQNGEPVDDGDLTIAARAVVNLGNEIARHFGSPGIDLKREFVSEATRTNLVP